MKYLFATLIAFLILDCSYSQKNQYMFSTDFKLSSDDSYLVTTIFHNNQYAIFEINLEDSCKVTQISFPRKNESHFNPVFSPDNKYILFISKENDNLLKRYDYTEIVLYDRINKSFKTITNQKKYISQALFSPDGQKIIFTEAGFYGSYSPVGPKMAHNSEIYSINLYGANKTKLTNVGKNYTMSDLSYFNSSSVMVNVVEPNKLSGLFAFSITDTAIHKKIELDTTNISNFEYVPCPLTTSDFSKIIFSSFTSIYIQALNEHRAKEIYSTDKNFRLFPLATFHKKNKLLFAKVNYNQVLITADDFSILTIDLETKKLEKLKLTVR